MIDNIMIKKIGILLFSIFLLFVLTTCGLDEYYYLPPVNQVIMMATDAYIYLPSIDTAYYYVEKFSIFYRIYLSNEISENIDTSGERTSVNPQLENDFNYFNNTFISPANAAAPSTASFTNRNYYQINTSFPVLAAIPGASARTIQISFKPEENAIIIDDNASPKAQPILRNNNLQLLPDEYFKYDDTLLNYDDYTGPNNIYNRDVTGYLNNTYTTIYVSMYIVTEGRANFRSIYSRPKHIGVFRLQ